MPLRHAFLLLAASVPVGLLFGATFANPAVLPDPPLSGQRLAFVATLPAMSCFNDLTVRDVVTTGMDIMISYSITPAVTPADHYFITSDLNGIGKLDAGDFAWWQRTGETFPVISATVPVAAGFSPVCRVYGRPEAGLDSHFYSASTAECAAVVERFADAWLLESASLFSVSLPNAVDGRCESGSTPVYRLFDNRPDANHRYTTSISIRDEMVAVGWIPEEFGPQAVAMCAP